MGQSNFLKKKQTPAPLRNAQWMWSEVLEQRYLFWGVGNLGFGSCPCFPHPPPLLNSQQRPFPPKHFHPCRRTPIIRKRLGGGLGCLPGAFWAICLKDSFYLEGMEPHLSEQKVNWDQSPKIPFFIPGSDLRFRLLTSRDQELPEALPWLDLTFPAANPERQEPVWRIPILASPRRA